MSTLSYCAKQATAMAEFETDRAKQKLDDAIDAEASREEMIAARAEELIVKRTAELSLDDVRDALHSADGSVKLIRDALAGKDRDALFAFISGLVGHYISTDSETMAQEWMHRIDREVAAWEH